MNTEEKLMKEFLRDNSYEETLELVKNITDRLPRGMGRGILKTFIQLSEEDHDRVKKLEEECYNLRKEIEQLRYNTEDR